MLQPYLQAGRLECGVDEAGRGALAGPVVAAAVILPENARLEGLNDSKKLSEAKREALRTEIIEQAVSWAVGIGSVPLIDRLNILGATYHAMHEAIDGLATKPQHLLIDGKYYRPAPQHAALAYSCVVGGDGKLAAIAAASILAKTYRDDIMRQLHNEHPAYGWQQNKGYGTAAHRQAIAQHGPTAWHRRSFSWGQQALLF